MHTITIHYMSKDATVGLAPYYEEKLKVLCGYLLDVHAYDPHDAISGTTLEEFVSRYPPGTYEPCQECLNHPDYPLHLLNLLL